MIKTEVTFISDFGNGAKGMSLLSEGDSEAHIMPAVVLSECSSQDISAVLSPASFLLLPELFGTLLATHIEEGV